MARRFSAFGYTLPVALVAGLLSFTFSVGPTQRLLGGDLFGAQPLGSPQEVAVDDQGLLYAVDSLSGEVEGFTPEGRLLWRHTIGEGPELLARGDLLAARPSGGVVAARTGPTARELVAVSSEGRLEGVLVRLDDSELLGSLEIRSEELWYQTLTGGTVRVRSRPASFGGPTDPNRHRIRFEVKLPPGVEPVATALVSEGLLLSDRSGRMLLVSADGAVSVPAFAAGGQLRKPWTLRVGADGRIFVLDLLGRVVLRADSLNSRGLSPVLGESDLVNRGLDRPHWGSIGLSPRGVLAAADRFAGTVTLQRADGSLTVISTLTLSDALRLRDLAFAGIPLLFLVTTVWSLWELLRQLLASRASVLLKLLTFLLPLVATSLTFGTFELARWLEAQYQQELRTRVTFVATWAGSMISGDALKSIETAADVDGDAHRSLISEVAAVQQLPESGRSDLRFRVFRSLAEEFYLVVGNPPDYGVLYPWGGTGRERLAAARGGTTEYVQVADGRDLRASALAPIRGSDTAIVGLLEVSVIEDPSQKFFRVWTARLTSGLGLSMLLILLLALAGAVGNLIARKEPVRGSLAKLGHPTENQRPDASSMNARQLETWGRLQEIGHSAARYFPRDVATLLGRPHLADIVPGDHVRLTLTLLCVALPPPDTGFERLAEYTALVMPILRKHGGFLAGLSDDHLVAMLPAAPELGLMVARELLEAAQAGDLPVPGIGVHRHLVTVGFRGTAERLAPFFETDGQGLAQTLAQRALAEGTGVLISG